MSSPPEADLRRLFDRAPVGFYRSTVDGRFLYANPALVAMLGYDRVEEVLGLSLATEVYEDAADRERLIAAYVARRLDGVVVRWRTRAGAPLIVRLYGYAVDDERGRGFEVTAVDETALHAAEAEVGAQRALVQRSEAALSMLIDQVPAIITIVDRDLRFTSARGSGMRALGMTVDDVLGRTMLDIVPATDPSIAHARAALAGETRSFEYEMAGRQLAVSVAPLREAGDAIVGSVAIAIDVTDARRFEARLQTAARAESLGVLAGGVAHDFNNLLVAMLGNADLALLDLPPGADARVAVDAIRTAALRAAELTDQLLAVAGRSLAATTHVDLRALVGELLVLLRPTFPPEFTVDVVIAPETPAVKADPTQLRQVMLNLIANARDAINPRAARSTSPPPIAGSPPPSASPAPPPAPPRARSRGHLVVRAAVIDHDGTSHDDDVLGAPPGDHVMIEVADDGPGMDETTRRRIFEPFFTTKPHGHGLGLAAVLGIVRGHGGGIRLTSAPGAGTRFTLFWPAARRAQVVGTRRVLVVDDEAMVRDVVCRMLSDVGYITIAASDGPTAIAHVRDGDPIDAVILDLTMPGMPGRDVLETLATVAPSLPVIVCSGQDRDRTAAPGAAAFLPKPFHFDDLVAALEAVLAR